MNMPIEINGLLPVEAHLYIIIRQLQSSWSHQKAKMFLSKISL